MTPPWLLLREARRGAGLTQRDLAVRMGVTQGAVAQLERPGANPTVASLDRALAATGRQLTLASAPLPEGFDRALIERNLRMTPAERIAAFETSHRELEELRRLMPDAG